MIEQSCLVCSAKTFAKPSHVAKGAGKYCSRACKGIAAKQRSGPLSSLFKGIEVKCEVCSKLGFIKPSRLGKEGRFCSYACRGVEQSIMQVGERNANFKHGESYTTEYQRKAGSKWRANNKEIISITNKNTKARRKLAEGSFTKNDVNLLFEVQNGTCWWCYEHLSNYHVDHVIPIARGGDNWPDNIVLSCPACNVQRRHSLVEEWYAKPKCRAKRRLNGNYTGNVSAT